MTDTRTVTFHPMQPGWWFHHYDSKSHELASYPVVGFESVSLPYAPDPNSLPNPEPRVVETRMEYLQTDAVVAVVLTGRPGEATFRVCTDESVGAADGCTENWLGLYPTNSREQLLDHFAEDIDAMRENLRKGGQIEGE